jgi:Domain of unknown function (DUF3387)
MSPKPYARPQMGDETLRAIARELVVVVQDSATLDWQLKENVRTVMRSEVKRLLNEDEVMRLQAGRTLDPSRGRNKVVKSSTPPPLVSARPPSPPCPNEESA